MWNKVKEEISRELSEDSDTDAQRSCNQLALQLTPGGANRTQASLVCTSLPLCNLSLQC